MQESIKTKPAEEVECAVGFGWPIVAVANAGRGPTSQAAALEVKSRLGMLVVFDGVRCRFSFVASKLTRARRLGPRRCCWHGWDELAIQAELV